MKLQRFRNLIYALVLVSASLYLYLLTFRKIGNATNEHNQLTVDMKSRAFQQVLPLDLQKRIFLRQSTNEFQPMGHESSQSYVYSAYIDDRPGAKDINASSQEPVVRLFVWLDRHKLLPMVKSKNWQCIFWDKDAHFVAQSTIVAGTDLTPNYTPFKLPSVPAMLVCQLPSSMSTVNKSFFVSIVLSPNSYIGNVVPLVDLPARRVRQQSTKQSVDFAMCVKPVYFGPSTDSVNKFVEFIEVSRMFGAKRFLFYVVPSQFNQTSAVTKCLSAYTKLGVVEIIPWSLPENVSRRGVRSRGQFLQMTECSYRLMYLTKYLVQIDIDEMIVPTKLNSWAELINDINKKTLNERNATGDKWIASYNFRNRFFPLKGNDTFNQLPIETQQELNSLAGSYHFNSLSRTIGEDRLFPYGKRSKTITVLENVLCWDVHDLKNHMFVPLGMRNYNVQEHEGILHHYRLVHVKPASKHIIQKRMLNSTRKIIDRLRIGFNICEPDDNGA